MKFIILCALFAPIIYLAFRQKKWYLNLLFAFAAILPEQFSLKINGTLPLLTGTRILILIVMGFWIYDKWKTKQFRIPKSILIFFAVNLLISLVNLRYGTDDINRIFLLIFERVLFVIVLMDMIHDKEEFHRCMDFAIMGCAALAVIGIMQTVFSYDVASVLHITKTITSIRLHDRMGLVRAFGTYNAISFGCYCTFMLMLILYRLYNTKSIWHSIAFALTGVALICTFTRSAWLCFAGILFIALILYRLKLIRRLLPSAAIAIALILVLCCFQPKLSKAFIETGKSSLNTVFSVLQKEEPSAAVTDPTETGLTQPTEQTLTEPSSPTMEESVPEESVAVQRPVTSNPVFELDEEFGMNANDPTYSRMAQWTCVEYMMKDGSIWFGYGYNALLHGRIHFFFDRWAAQWQSTTFLDVGILAWITESGLIGLCSYLGLLGYMLITALRKKSKEKNMDFYRLVILMVPLYLLLNYLASFPYATIVWLFFALFYAYQKLSDTTNTTPPEQEEQTCENL